MGHIAEISRGDTGVGVGKARGVDAERLSYEDLACGTRWFYGGSLLKEPETPIDE